ncbi:DUF4160 domain-containing protein [Gloeocapsa sp. PCC 73106]|uniref:DUF4160 domain-containing protein n=1 Tax=Gloeocapsa sp. PCC 73106 TaxID=102232 RepID=UPI0009FDA430
MATIHREDGFIVRIWSNDHLPCHVHIFKAEGTCVINLCGEHGLPTYVRLTRWVVKL